MSRLSHSRATARASRFATYRLCQRSSCCIIFRANWVRLIPRPLHRLPIRTRLNCRTRVILSLLLGFSQPIRLRPPSKRVVSEKLSTAPQFEYTKAEVLDEVREVTPEAWKSSLWSRRRHLSMGSISTRGLSEFLPNKPRAGFTTEPQSLTVQKNGKKKSPPASRRSKLMARKPLS